MSKVLLVSGSRHFTDYRTMDRWLDQSNPDVLIHGDARGADTLAHEWAVNSGCEVIPFPAKWQEFGKKAGTLRNKEMLEYLLKRRSMGDQVAVIAFPLEDSIGTRHMISIARNAGVRTAVVTAKSLEVK